MGLVSPTQVTTGTTIDAADVNTPVNQIAAVVNGNIDNDNINASANISGSKLAAASIPGSKLGSPYAPQGYLQNGRISASVATNDLTVAIKTLAGTDPSASDPVYVRIGNTVRSITAALSVTKNDGTNWFNSGSTEHATQDIDYFCYLGYNATDGVVIGFARIPYARIYGDFSATTTNEKYAAISTITNAVSTDEYEVVGRFNAALSATAAFNWSIPATAIVINRPIFETRRLTYSCNPTGITVGNGTLTSYYKIVGRRMSGEIIFIHGSTSSMTTTPAMSLPMSANSTAPVESVIGMTTFVDAGTTVFYGKTGLGSASAANPWLESVGGSYGTRTNLSTTIPMTWTTNDQIISTFEADL